jgi:hypothetical protein
MGSYTQDFSPFAPTLCVDSCEYGEADSITGENCEAWLG